jgi:hypothetical protein
MILVVMGRPDLKRPKHNSLRLYFAALASGYLSVPM